MIRDRFTERKKVFHLLADKTSFWVTGSDGGTKSYQDIHLISQFRNRRRVYQLRGVNF